MRMGRVLGGFAAAILAGGCAAGGGPRLLDVELAEPVAPLGGKLTVLGRVDGGGPLTAGGQPVSIDAEGRFRVTVPVRDGENRVAVRVGDTPAGTLILHVDSRPPEVLITEPIDKHRTGGTTVRVRGRVRDRHLVRVDVNGRAATVRKNRFEATVPLAPGKNVVAATAYDAAGNTARFAIRVYRK